MVIIWGKNVYLLKHKKTALQFEISEHICARYCDKSDT